MAGHSKWANIKHRKAAQDAKRGKVWTKVSREITVAARLGGGDPDTNPRLRDALAMGRAHNMPKDTMERALKKGTGELEGQEYVELTYEGYSPGGAAVFVEAMTDNRNRTVGELRFLFSKNGGNLGESGCVAWMFKKKGYLEIPKSAIDEEKLFETAIELGAEDLDSSQDEVYSITCEPNDLSSLREGLENQEIPIARFETVAEPSNNVELDAENAEKTIKLLEGLDDLDDVQNVHTNADFPD